MNIQFKSHKLRTPEKHLDQFLYKGKDLFIASGDQAVESINPGDWLTFNQSDEQFEVKYLRRYCSVREALRCENYTRTVLGACKKSVAETVFGEMLSNKDTSLGIFVIEIRKVGLTQIVSLGDMAKVRDGSLQSMLKKVMKATDHLNADYPKRSNWYWSTFVPGLSKGERDGIVFMINNKVAGISLVKKVPEQKICTFVVAPNHYHNGVTMTLLSLSFAAMGTGDPLISINEKRLSDFQPMIDKYHWKQTQILSPSYYGNREHEIVFNGKIA